MAVNTFSSNIAFEEEQFAFCKSMTKQYVTHVLGWTNTRGRKATTEENKAGVDYLVKNMDTGEIFKVDWKVRRNASKYWRQEPDCLIEISQSGKGSWATDHADQDITIMSLYPENAVKGSRWASYAAIVLHIGDCAKIAEKVISGALQKPLKVAHNGASKLGTSNVMMTLSELDSLGITYVTMSNAN
jgi:hypothetical protein